MAQLLGDRLGVDLGGAASFSAVLVELLDVATSAECASRAGEDENAHGGILVGVCE